MVANNFFCLKIAGLKGTVCRVGTGNTSIDVKTGSSDPADFAMTGRFQRYANV
jgi:hypothetical protein